MKLCFFIVITLSINFNNFNFAQSSFEIDGSVNGVSSGIIQILPYTWDTAFTVTENETALNNGKFSFKGIIKYPTFAYLKLKDSIQDSKWFFIDPGKQLVSINISNGLLYVASDAPSFLQDNLISDQMSDFRLKERAITEKIDSIYASTLTDILVKNIEELILTRKHLEYQQDSFLLQWIKANPGSYAGISWLATRLRHDGNDSLWDSAYNSLDNKIKSTPPAINISEKLRRSRSISVGLKFPSFEVKDIYQNKDNLNHIKLSEYTLIDFWFSSCGSCIQQFPELRNLYSKYKNKGFQIISVSVEMRNQFMTWKQSIKKYKLIWPQYWDMSSTQCKNYVINYFPTNFLLDGSGVILARNIDLLELDNLLAIKLKHW